MICNPKKGQRVKMRYAKGKRQYVTLHGRTGTVVFVGHGKPRNHGVIVDGKIYVVPCGNLVDPSIGVG